MIVSGGKCHLGDLMWVFSLITKIPEKHTFYMLPQFVEGVRSLCEGYDIEPLPLEAAPSEDYLRSIDCWIANGRFGMRYDHPLDIMGYVRRYMNCLGESGGYPNLLPTPESMLCDYPAIENAEVPDDDIDILAINSNPESGQCLEFSNSEFDVLLAVLSTKYRVLAVNPTDAVPYGKFTLAQIGKLSTRAPIIMGVANGPMFPTFNIWNKSARHYVFLRDLHLDFGVHCESFPHVAALAKRVESPI